jgi:hypothetical protein
MENRYCQFIDKATIHLKGHPCYCDCVSFYTPRKERLEFSIKQILAYIDYDSLGIAHPSIMIVAQRGAFNYAIFDYYRLVGGYRFRCIEQNFLPKDFNEYNYDYLVFEKLEGDSLSAILGKEYFERVNEIPIFRKLFNKGFTGFELARVFKIPNSNNFAYVYRNKQLHYSKRRIN